MLRNLIFVFYLFGTALPFFSQKPHVVVLGVGHSTQLINYTQQPAALREFIDKVKPKAICIERSPEEYSRNDFYEFTYEQQYIVIPYAKDNSIPLHPVDWLPSETDTEIGFGMKDLSVPRFARQKEGFLGFTTFTESADFEDDLYFAEKPNYIRRIESWYASYPEKASSDLPRCLFLYRTFMQSKRIQKVLENYSSGDTVLVIIGAFHKNDIEKHLTEQGYRVVQPSTFGIVDQQAIDQHFQRPDAYAILSFNLLGMQANLNKINDQLVEYALTKIEDVDSGEIELFKIRRAVLLKKLSPKDAASQYHKLLSRIKDEQWTWNGVKDRTRVDSYFDPFGNLTLDDRIRLELAREYRKLSKDKNYREQIDIIRSKLSPYKKAMFDHYIEKYLD
ncbi:hypothetical protein [Chryseobacterium taeanense]|uniref:hypothetical protein n=1 Tax=Chryseobacterium taeanense TaxID=311334 RepID=UPI0035AFB36F